MTPKSMAISLLVAVLSAGPAPAQEKVSLLEAVDRAAAEIVTEKANVPLILARQEPTEAQKRAGLWKIVGGIGLASTGGLLAVTSETSGLVQGIPLGSAPVEVSARSTGQLVAGLAMIGGGALLAVFGFKDRNP